LYSRFAFKINPGNIRLKYGKKSYVLITGGSDGIGLAFAKLFGKLGFNLILWSRNKKKLEDVKNMLKSNYPKIEIHIIAKDFGNSVKNSFYSEELKKIENLDISILVNNVGYIPNGKKFSEFKISWLVNAVNVNVIPQAVLSRYFIEKFKQRKESSALIDVSSIISDLPVPFYNIYGASKLFNTYFSQSINNQYCIQYKNISNISIIPGPVQSNMSNQIDALLRGSKSSGFIDSIRSLIFSTPEITSLESLKGLELKRMRATGFVNHGILHTLIKCILIVFPFIKDLLGNFRFIRKFNRI
jgi:short-subunit dehydrogenase